MIAGVYLQAPFPLHEQQLNSCKLRLSIESSHRYTVVYEVELPGNVSTNDQLSIHMCSPGGYDQVSLCHETELHK